MNGNTAANAGQLGLGSSRPGQISAWSHIKPGGNVFNKKEFIQQKVGGRMSDTKKHNYMCRLFHFLYGTRDTP